MNWVLGGVYFWLIWQSEIALRTENDTRLREVERTLFIKVPTPRHNFKAHIKIVLQNCFLKRTQIIYLDFVEIQRSQLVYIKDQWVLSRASKTLQVLPHSYIRVDVFDAQPKLVENFAKTELVEKAFLLSQDLIEYIVDLVILREAQFRDTVLISFLYESLEVVLELGQRGHERFALVVHEEHLVRKDLLVFDEVRELDVAVAEVAAAH